jgi:hypothetical protein
MCPILDGYGFMGIVLIPAFLRQLCISCVYHLRQVGGYGGAYVWRGVVRDSNATLGRL